MIVFIAAVHLLVLAVVLGNLWYLRRTPEAPTGRKNPHVSILIPARNEEENIQRLLPSLLGQQYLSFDVIVYDDGSEDRTWDVLQSFKSTKLKTLRGSGPPRGWVGKVHALYQATRSARGEAYLFLDADAQLEDDQALGRLVERFLALPRDSVLTGLTQLRGGGLLLVSLVPNAILGGIPWFLAKRLPFRALGALNGQCWLISAENYHKFEPHEHVADEVLEDVQIGRYLKEQGITPELADLQDEVSVFMYRDFREAWEGFRKNAYLLLGGSPVTFVPLLLLYVAVAILAPFFSLWFLLSLYVIKRLTDRASGFSPGISLLAPVSFLLCGVLHAHSAWSHWTGNVSWKGRRIRKR